MQELCPEDKAKIGELVKKLALETKAKQECILKYAQERDQLANRLAQLEGVAGRNETEKEKMRGKLTESVRLLKQLKHQKVDAERQNQECQRQLHRVQKELLDRENEAKRIKDEA